MDIEKIRTGLHVCTRLRSGVGVCDRAQQSECIKGTCYPLFYAGKKSEGSQCVTDCGNKWYLNCDSE